MSQICKGTQRNVSNGSRRTGSYEIEGCVDTRLVRQYQLRMILVKRLHIQIRMPFSDPPQTISVMVMIDQPEIS